LPLLRQHLLTVAPEPKSKGTTTPAALAAATDSSSPGESTVLPCEAQQVSSVGREDGGGGVGDGGWAGGGGDGGGSTGAGSHANCVTDHDGHTWVLALTENTNASGIVKSNRYFISSFLIVRL